MLSVVWIHASNEKSPVLKLSSDLIGYFHVTGLFVELYSPQDSCGNRCRGLFVRVPLLVESCEISCCRAGSSHRAATTPPFRGGGFHTANLYKRLALSCAVGGEY